MSDTNHEIGSPLSPLGISDAASGSPSIGRRVVTTANGVSTTSIAEFQTLYAHHPHRAVSLSHSVGGIVSTQSAVVSPLMGIITGVQVRWVTPASSMGHMPPQASISAGFMTPHHFSLGGQSNGYGSGVPFAGPHEKSNTAASLSVSLEQGKLLTTAYNNNTRGNTLHNPSNSPGGVGSLSLFGGSVSSTVPQYYSYVTATAGGDAIFDFARLGPSGASLSQGSNAVLPVGSQSSALAGLQGKGSDVSVTSVSPSGAGGSQRIVEPGSSAGSSPSSMLPVFGEPSETTVAPSFPTYTPIETDDVSGRQRRAEDEDDPLGGVAAVDPLKATRPTAASMGLVSVDEGGNTGNIHSPLAHANHHPMLLSAGDGSMSGIGDGTSRFGYDTTDTNSAGSPVVRNDRSNSDPSALPPLPGRDSGEDSRVVAGANTHFVPPRDRQLLSTSSDDDPLGLVMGGAHSGRADGPTGFATVLPTGSLHNDSGTDTYSGSASNNTAASNASTVLQRTLPARSHADSKDETATIREAFEITTQSDEPLVADKSAEVAPTQVSPCPPPQAEVASQQTVAEVIRRQSAFAGTTFSYREATEGDAEGIIALRDSLDMTNATSFVWPLEEMRQRITDRYPLIIIAVAADPREDSPTYRCEIVVGVSGIDLKGMEKDFPIRSIGSRVLGVPANTDYVFPDTYCMCRGLLIHPLFQGAGLGSKLHKGRLQLLADIAPNTPGVILSARGSTIEETLSVIVPHIVSDRDTITPEFTKDDLFEFTFHTSQGIVHMVHGKDREGWKFVGVDIADGGPVWVTCRPLLEVVAAYDVVVAAAYVYPMAAPVRRSTQVFPDPFAFGGLFGGRSASTPIPETC